MAGKEKNNESNIVFIPKENKNDDALYVAVNGKRMLVQKGISLTLPPEFAEVVRNSQDAARKAEAYISAVSAG